jgi:hypothetical protein
MITFVIKNSDRGRVESKAGQVLWVRTRADRRFQENLLTDIHQFDGDFLKSENPRLYLSSTESLENLKLGYVIPSITLNLERGVTVRELFEWRLLSGAEISSDQRAEFVDYINKAGLSKYLDSGWVELSTETRHYLYVAVELYKNDVVLVFLGDAKFSSREVATRWIEMVQKITSISGKRSLILVDKVFGINPQPEIWVNADMSSSDVSSDQSVVNSLVDEG